LRICPGFKTGSFSNFFILEKPDREVEEKKEAAAIDFYLTELN